VRIGNHKGGFDFRHGNNKPLDVSASAKKSVHSEADQQQAFFDVIRQSAPKPPVLQRRKLTGKNKGQPFLEEQILDDQFLNHPLYELTRVRHFPNEGNRSALTAWSQGIIAGAFDIYLDAARTANGKLYFGWRAEFKTLDGTVSKQQQAERLWLDREGYFAHYYYHYVEALSMLAFYLDIPHERLIGFPRSRHALRDFAPEKAHDQLCGCEFKIAELINF
jgi:hypothetical protein